MESFLENDNPDEADEEGAEYDVGNMGLEVDDEVSDLTNLNSQTGEKRLAENDQELVSPNKQMTRPRYSRVNRRHIPQDLILSRKTRLSHTFYHYIKVFQW